MFDKMRKLGGESVVSEIICRAPVTLLRPGLLDDDLANPGLIWSSLVISFQTVRFPIFPAIGCAKNIMQPTYIFRIIIEASGSTKCSSILVNA